MSVQAYDAQDIEEPVVEAKDSMEAAHSGEDDEEEEEEDDEARSDSNPPDEVDAVMNKGNDGKLEDNNRKLLEKLVWW